MIVGQPKDHEDDFPTLASPTRQAGCCSVPCPDEEMVEITATPVGNLYRPPFAVEKKYRFACKADMVAGIIDAIADTGTHIDPKRVISVEVAAGVAEVVVAE